MPQENTKTEKKKISPTKSSSTNSHRIIYEQMNETSFKISLERLNTFYHNDQRKKYQLKSNRE